VAVDSEVVEVNERVGVPVNVGVPVPVGGLGVRYLVSVTDLERPVHVVLRLSVAVLVSVPEISRVGVMVGGERVGVRVGLQVGGLGVRVRVGLGSSVPDRVPERVQEV
jgi:hypothetical protein